MNRRQQYERHEEIRRHHEALVAQGLGKTSINTLAVIYNMTSRQIRNIIKENHDN